MQIPLLRRDQFVFEGAIPSEGESMSLMKILFAFTFSSYDLNTS